MTSPQWTTARVAKVWLDVVLVLGGVAMALFVLWLIVSPWVMKGGMMADTSVPVAIGDRTVFPRLILETSSDASEFASAGLMDGYADLQTLTSDWRLHFASVGSIALASLVILWAVWLLREVLRTTLAGQPFARDNGQRLRRIGWIVLALATLAPIGEYLLGRALLQRLTIEGIPLSPAFRFSKDGLLLGILLLVLTAIFRHGSELEEERSLTV